MDIKKLSATVQPYRWGDTYYIPQLLQKRATSKPQAELWMGTHPQGPSSIKGEELSLQEYLESNPEEILGPSHLQRFGISLPFLFKVLAINEPLSLQVHPSSALAKEGFALEAIEREHTDPSLLNYKDDKQKDEVLYALTPVTAMVGFKSIEDIRSSFTQFLPDPSLLFGEETSVETFFLSLLKLEGEQKHEVIDFLKAYVEGIEGDATSLFLSPSEIAKRALELYDDDIMVCSPFFLNVVHLKRGEALHVTPRTLHAYVYGQATELMSCSDNVLRGGLTHKKVDVPELLKVMNFTPLEPKIAPMRSLSDTIEQVEINSNEFVYQIYHQGEVVREGRTTVEIALVVEGSSTFYWDDKQLRCTRGDVLLIPSSIDSFSIDNGGLIISASVPSQ